MSRIGTIDFKGVTGHKYTFNVYPLKNEFDKDKGAVYVITHRVVKSDGLVDHSVLYTGATENISSVQKMVENSECFSREHANCICTYWEDNPASRAKINDDLVNFYHPPCNYE